MTIARRNLLLIFGLLPVTLFTCTGAEVTAPNMAEPVVATASVSAAAIPAPERAFKTCLEREGEARIYRSGSEFRATVRMNKSAETLTFDTRHCQFIGETANQVGSVYLQSFTCSVGNAVLTDGYSPLDREPTLRIRRGTDVLIELNSCVTAGGEATTRSATSAEDFSLSESMTVEPQAPSIPVRIDSEAFQSVEANTPRTPLHLRCRSIHGVSKLTIDTGSCHGQAKLAASRSLVMFEARSCHVSRKMVAKAWRDFCDCSTGDMRMTNEPSVSDERDLITITSGGHILGEFGKCSRSDTETTD